MDSVYEVRGDKLEISLSVVTPHFVRGVHFDATSYFLNFPKLTKIPTIAAPKIMAQPSHIK